MNEISKVTVSLHAERRLRKRLGVPRRSVRRIAIDAYLNGRKREDVTGLVRRYMDRKFEDYGKNANNMRLHHNRLFMFTDQLLVTVYLLPESYR